MVRVTIPQMGESVSQATITRAPQGQPGGVEGADLIAEAPSSQNRLRSRPKIRALNQSKRTFTLLGSPTSRVR